MIIDKIKEYDLTANQAVVLFFLFNRKVDEFIDYKEKLQSLELDPLSGVEKRDLIRRGFLIRKGKKIVANRDKNIFSESELNISERVERFMNAYPFYYVDGDKKLPLKLVDAKQFSVTFNKKVKTDHELNLIIEDVNYGVENNLINMRIDKFIIHDVYLDIRRRRRNKITKRKDHGDF